MVAEDGWEDAPSADVERVGFGVEGEAGAGWEAALAVAVGDAPLPWDDAEDDSDDEAAGGGGVASGDVDYGYGYGDSGYDSGQPDSGEVPVPSMSRMPFAGEPLPRPSAEDVRPSSEGVRPVGEGELVEVVPAGGVPVPGVPVPAADDPDVFNVGDGLDGLIVDDAAMAAGSPLPAMPEGDGKSGRKRKKAKRSKAIGGLRLTTQDHQIIGFLGRYKVATVAQLSRRFDRSMPALRNRMPRLERAGLVDSYYGAENRTKVWVATEAGMRTVQMFLPGTSQIAWGWLRHQLHLVDIGIVMERAGEIVLTEREIRAASTRKHTPRAVDGYLQMDAPTPRMQTAYEQADGGEGWSVAELTRARYTVPKVGRPSGFGHIPDMVLLRQPFPDGRSGNIAIELELSRKNTSKWQDILEAYVRYDGYAQVHYFFTDRGLLRSVQAVARGIPGGSEKVKVSLFKPVDQTWNPKAAKQ